MTWDNIKHLYSKDFKKLQSGKGVTSYESMYAVHPVHLAKTLIIDHEAMEIMHLSFCQRSHG